MNLRERLILVLTGKREWTNPKTGKTVIVYEDLSSSWAVANLFQYLHWRWVEKFCLLECGCTVKFVTRRVDSAAEDCRKHNIFYGLIPPGDIDDV